MRKSRWISISRSSEEREHWVGSDVGEWLDISNVVGVQFKNVFWLRLAQKLTPFKWIFMVANARGISVNNMQWLAIKMNAPNQNNVYAERVQMMMKALQSTFTIEIRYSLLVDKYNIIEIFLNTYIVICYVLVAMARKQSHGESDRTWREIVMIITIGRKSIHFNVSIFPIFRFLPTIFPPSFLVFLPTAIYTFVWWDRGSCFIYEIV